MQNLNTSNELMNSYYKSDFRCVADKNMSVSTQCTRTILKPYISGREENLEQTNKQTCFRST